MTTAAMSNSVGASHGNAFHPGWLGQLLTTPIHGLDASAVLPALDDPDAIKAYVEIGDTEATGKTG